MLAPDSRAVLEPFRGTPWPCCLKPVVFSSVGAGLHRSAVPGAAAPWGLELPGPYLEPPLETQPARTPLGFHPGVLSTSPWTPNLGGKMEAVQMFMPCSFDSLCV